MARRDIERIIKKYAEDVRKKIPSSIIYIFGSYAKGKYKKDSDIDIAVISDYFKGMNRVDADLILYDLADKYDVDIQPIAYTFEDIEKDDFVKEEILRKGRKIS